MLGWFNELRFDGCDSCMGQAFLATANVWHSISGVARFWKRSHVRLKSVYFETPVAQKIIRAIGSEILLHLYDTLYLYIISMIVYYIIIVISVCARLGCGPVPPTVKYKSNLLFILKFLGIVGLRTGIHPDPWGLHDPIWWAIFFKYRWLNILNH